MMRWLGRPDREYREEIEEHIHLETQENIERGMSPEEARLAARRTFGNPGVVRERLLEARPWYRVDTLLHDVRYGLRSIRRNPWLAVMIVLTLSAGIGLNAAAFTMIDALLLRAQVDKDPSQFFSVLPTYSDPHTRLGIGQSSYVDFLAYQKGTQSLGDLAASSEQLVTLEGKEVIPAEAMLVSRNFFQVYGPDRPLLGRLFLPEECGHPGGEPVAVVSEKFWASPLGSDPDIVGRTLTLNRHTITVVGVASSRTFSTGNGVIWIPLTMASELSGPKNAFQAVSAYWLRVEGRLKPGHSRAEVASALRVIAGQQEALRPGRRTTIQVTNGAAIHLAGDDEDLLGLGLIETLLALVLLIACVNVSTVLLARAASRQREMAVRISLGAGRMRQARMLLTESLVLAAGAAAISVWMAYRLPPAIMRAFHEDPAASSLEPHWTVFAYLAGITLAAGSLAGLTPIVESLRVNLSVSLKGQQTATGAAGSRRTRSFLIAAQVAMSLLLMAAAGLVARTESGKLSAGPDFETRKVLVVRLLAPRGTRPESILSFFRAIEEKLRAAPTVESAAFDRWWGAPSLEGEETVDVTVGGTRQMVSSLSVSPDFFQVLGISILSGRTFTAVEDAERAPAAAIVTERMSRLFWPGENPLGKRFPVARQQVFEVVGVARDNTAGLSRDAQAQYYIPRGQTRAGLETALLRFGGDPRPLEQAVMRMLVDAHYQNVGRPQTLHDWLEEEAHQYLALTRLVLSLGGLAMLLAVVGIYGVAAFAAGQRTRELGIRAALGATRSEMIRLILLDGLKPVLAGLAAGMVMAAGLAHGLAQATRDDSFPLNARDPVPYIAVTLVLTLAALAAMLVPAMRAAKSDPLWALRQD
jgi:predicted permease